MGRNLRIGVLVICVLTMAGCAESTEAGHSASPGASSGAAAPSSPPPRPVVSPTLLDAGRYPTKPAPPLGVSGNPGAGAVADAQHLADVVIGPWEADDSLVGTYLNTYYVIGTAQALQQLGPETIAAAAQQHGLIDGFASARQDPDKTAMVNAVLRFPDPAAATAASTAMGAASAAQPVMGAMPTAVPIPGHPEAVASTYPFTPRGTTQPRATIRSFAAHGPYVLLQFVQSVDGVDRAAALVAKAIEAQGPAVDAFTPAGDLAAVPLDPTGLLAKTLPNPKAANTKNAVYGAGGAEHFQSNPKASAQLFKDTGTTAVAMGSTNVYQTRNEGSALMVTNAFNKEISSDGTTVVDAVPALPDSHCYALPKTFYCVVPAGRFAIEARSDTLDDTHQQLSAQYVLLTS